MNVVCSKMWFVETKYVSKAIPCMKVEIHLLDFKIQTLNYYMILPLAKEWIGIVVLVVTQMMKEDSSLIIHFSIV